MASHDLFQVPQTLCKTSVGEVQCPIFYQDVSVFFAHFWGDPARVKEKLAGTGLVPARFWGGRVVISLTFFEYRKTSIGPYNEVGLAVPVYVGQVPANAAPYWDFFRAPKRRQMGAYVIDLPVTTAIAHAAGKELWGYPKFVTEIPLSFQPRAFEGKVLDPDTKKPIFSLQGEIGLGIPLPGFDLLLFSILAGKLLRTVVSVNASFKTFRGNGFSLELGDSEHPMAKNLRDLELEGQKPFLLQQSTTFQSRLELGSA